MASWQRLPASLTPLDAALAMLLSGLEPVAPVALPPAEALHCVAAEMAPTQACPPYDVAATDGFALHARDLVGASSYSPVPLVSAPVWVEAGDPIPAGCDCVVDAEAIDVSVPMAQVMSEAAPGQGVRRAGNDIAAGSVVIAAGRRILPRDLLVARAAGLTALCVRRPRLRVVNIPGGASTADWIARSAQDAGAEVDVVAAKGRDAASIANMLDTGGCDLLVTIGGSGVGRRDATLQALAERGAVMAHGIALQPGRTSAVGRIGNTPVVVLPGVPTEAIAAWWTLACPALDRLSGRLPREPLGLPLLRKIASGLGLAEVVLLERKGGAWAPLASGEFSLQAIARADAWLAVPAGSEGFAAGATVDACMLAE